MVVTYQVRWYDDMHMFMSLPDTIQCLMVIQSKGPATLSGNAVRQ